MNKLIFVILAVTMITASGFRVKQGGLFGWLTQILNSSLEALGLDGTVADLLGLADDITDAAEAEAGHAVDIAQDAAAAFLAAGEDTIEAALDEVDHIHDQVVMISGAAIALAAEAVANGQDELAETIADAFMVFNGAVEDVQDLLDQGGMIAQILIAALLGQVGSAYDDLVEVLAEAEDQLSTTAAAAIEAVTSAEVHVEISLEGLGD